MRSVRTATKLTATMKNGTGCHAVTWGEERIEFQLRRTARRTLGITVRPDLAVVVTAPRKASVEKVLGKVRKRAGWIRRQQRFFEEFLPETPARRYVSGETHRYLGRQYRLKIVEADKADVKLSGRFILVHTPHKRNAEQVEKLVERWYLTRATDRFSRSLKECSARLGKRLANVPVMRLRRMPKRWGSWTRRSGICLNPELVKAPGACIDYVVTHELCHSVHGNHGRKFYALLRQVMPDWEDRKSRLEKIAAESGGQRPDKK